MHETVKAFKGVLDKYLMPGKGLREALRALFVRVLYGEDFDLGLIQFARLFAADFILSNPDFLLDKGSFVEAIRDEGMEPEQYVGTVIMDEYTEAPRPAFHALPAALGVLVLLYDFPSTEAQLSKSACPVHLKEPVNAKPETISLLLGPRGLLALLYPKSLLTIHVVLSDYDSGIDARVAVGPEDVVQPRCCSGRYYRSAYYSVMLKRNRGVTRKCVKCGGELDDGTFRLLKGMESRYWLLKALIFAVSVVLMVCSAAFILRLVKNYP